ncbi:MAG: hypothetical protein ACLSCR_02820 [Akkermansia sp.]
MQQVPELGAGLAGRRVVDGIVGKGVFHQEFQPRLVGAGVQAAQGAREGVVGDGSGFVPVIRAQQVDVRQKLPLGFRFGRLEHVRAGLSSLGGKSARKAENDECSVHGC